MKLKNLLEIAKELKATVQEIEKGNDNHFSARLFFDNGTIIPFNENGIAAEKRLVVKNFKNFLELCKKYGW